MGTVIPLERANSSIRSQLDNLLRLTMEKQRELADSHDRIKDLIWGVENDRTMADGNGRTLSKTEAQERLSTQLYETVVMTMRLRCIRGTIRRCIRLAKANDLYELNMAVDDLYSLLREEAA